MDKKTCCLCGSQVDVYKIPVFRAGFGVEQIYDEGNMSICKGCIDKCDICLKCKKTIMSKDIKEALGDWEALVFCDCNQKKTDYANGPKSPKIEVNAINQQAHKVENVTDSVLTENKTNINEKIWCISYLLALLFSIIVCIQQNSWSEEWFVNIIGFPVQIFFVTAFLGTILTLILLGIKKGIVTCIGCIKKLQCSNWHTWGYVTLACLLYAVFADSKTLYIFLRWAVLIFCICSFIRIYSKTPESKHLGVIGLIGILFNPIAPIALEKEIWCGVDLVVGLYFLYLLTKK